MCRPQLINNRLSSRMSGFRSLVMLRLRHALILLRVVGGGAPD